MAKQKTVQPSKYESESDLENYQLSDEDGSQDDGNSDDDEMRNISFGALNRAQKKIQEEEKNTKKTEKAEQIAPKKQIYKKHVPVEEDSDSDSESDDEFFGGSSKRANGKKSKHAPSEQSSKRKVSLVRNVPGLERKKETTLYTDIRFDAAYGKADLHRIRKDYGFLDDYRKKEIDEMQRILNDNKKRQLMDYREVQEMEYELQSMKSRMDTLRNRDLENKILSNYKKEQQKGFDEGKQSQPHFLKRSDKRKLLQKARFEGMKASQREKVMERKRKRRLGKEFKALEFNGPRN